jgi:hypothetical protein
LEDESEMDNQGCVMSGDPQTGHAFFIGLHSRTWIVVGDFAGTYMTDRSHRYDDDLIGPFATLEEARSCAGRRNDER